MSSRPKIQATCRAAWKHAGTAAARAHEQACGFCAARARAREALAPRLRVRPQSPPALAHPAFLEEIYARAADRSEQGPIGAWLDASPPPRVETAADLAESSAASGLARSLVRPPSPPSGAVWSSVRAKLLADVAAVGAEDRSPAGANGGGAPRRKLRPWTGLAASLAAAAALVAISSSNGTPQPPRIVFTELGKVPDVPFAIVRHGVTDDR